MTKRLYFDRNPADDEARQAIGKAVWDDIARFTHRLPTRRRNPRGRPHWDPLWCSSLQRAVTQLGFAHYYVNDGLLLLTAEEAASVKALAEDIWQEKSARFAR